MQYRGEKFGLDRLMVYIAAAPPLLPHRVHQQQASLCGSSAGRDPVDSTLAVVPS
jgi:hypothetical protein